MGMVRFDVSMEFIRDALSIPDNMEIVHIVRNDFPPYCFMFYVEGDVLPDVPEGEIPKLVIPVMEWKGGDRPRDFIDFSWSRDEG